MPVLNKHVEPNYMAFYGGHDSSFTIYNADQDKFYVIELEKLLGIKHFNWPGNFQSRKTHNIFQGDRNVIIELLKAEIIRLGLKPEFRMVLIGSYNGDLSHAWGYCIEPSLLLKHFQIDSIEVHKGHHVAHAWCAFMQVPVDRGVLITSDGGGDDGYFTVTLFDRPKKKFKRIAISQKDKHKLGGHYEGKAQEHLDSIAVNSPIAQDLAGKVMGAAAYGKPIGKLKSKRWFSHQGGVHKKVYNEWFSTANFYGETNRFRYINKNKMTWQEEVDTCAQIQLELEEAFIETIYELVPNFDQLIEDYDRNLVMSGGVALNIVNNKKLQEKYNCKVWVPCNPGDNGLSFGMITKWLVENNKMTFSHRYDVSFAGSPIRDLDRLEQFIDLYKTTCKKVSVSDVAEILRNGEVIALMHGNQETGFRSLGNRSILCDASIEGIKDKVNLTKRRELYRPFAPICLWEDAHKYFEVEGENNYKHMNIAVDVKPDANLPSITHADGTARLQAIEHKGIMYDLLKAHGGVLLNTSLNLSGKPIANTLFEVFHILERTPLDKLIIEKEGQLWCFEKYNDEIV